MDRPGFLCLLGVGVHSNPKEEEGGEDNDDGDRFHNRALAGDKILVRGDLARGVGSEDYTNRAVVVLEGGPILSLLLQFSGQMMTGS